MPGLLRADADRQREIFRRCNLAHDDEGKREVSSMKMMSYPHENISTKPSRIDSAAG